MYYAMVAVSAVTPSLLLVWYFHARDRYPEPQGILWATFALGVVSIVPAGLIGLPIYFLMRGAEGFLRVAGIHAFLLAALPEELCKLGVLLGFSFRRRAFDEPMDGIVYGVVASLGFATLENIMYVWSGGMWMALGRAMTAVPMHAFLGAILGFYVGQARFEHGRRRRGLILKGLAIAILLHGAYDFPLMAVRRWAHQVDETGQSVSDTWGLLGLGALVVLGLAAAWAIHLVSRLRAEQSKRVPPVPTPIPVARLKRMRIMGLAQVLVGGLIAGFAGTVTLAVILGLLAGWISHAGAVEAIVGDLVLAILPGVLGLLLFTAGVRKLNRVPVI
jgi:hypothetical protein